MNPDDACYRTLAAIRDTVEALEKIPEDDEGVGSTVIVEEVYPSLVMMACAATDLERARRVAVELQDFWQRTAASSIGSHAEEREEADARLGSVMDQATETEMALAYLLDLIAEGDFEKVQAEAQRQRPHA